jgi:predicted SprT family Zn-dependent metalloprotease
MLHQLIAHQLNHLIVWIPVNRYSQAENDYQLSCHWLSASNKMTQKKENSWFLVSFTVDVVIWNDQSSANYDYHIN